MACCAACYPVRSVLPPDALPDFETILYAVAHGSETLVYSDHAVVSAPRDGQIDLFVSSRGPGELGLDPGQVVHPPRPGAFPIELERATTFTFVDDAWTVVDPKDTAFATLPISEFGGPPPVDCSAVPSQARSISPALSGQFPRHPTGPIYAVDTDFHLVRLDGVDFIKVSDRVVNFSEAALGRNDDELIGSLELGLCAFTISTQTCEILPGTEDIPGFVRMVSRASPDGFEIFGIAMSQTGQATLYYVKLQDAGVDVESVEIPLKRVNSLEVHGGLVRIIDEPATVYFVETEPLRFGVGPLPAYDYLDVEGEIFVLTPVAEGPSWARIAIADGNTSEAIGFATQVADRAAHVPGTGWFAFDVGAGTLLSNFDFECFSRVGGQLYPEPGGMVAISRGSIARFEVVEP